jgi:hypothetical protein
VTLLGITEAWPVCSACVYGHAQQPSILSVSIVNIVESLTSAFSHPDDVRKGYKGCFADGVGPYVTALGSGRTLPTGFYTKGVTHEQCAQYAAQAGYEVFALQDRGFCFTGPLLMWLK